MKKKKLEFSKIVVIVSNFIVFFLVLFTGVYCWRTLDSTSLITLLDKVFYFVITTNGAYMWKAKNENILKIGGSIEDGSFENYYSSDSNDCDGTDYGSVDSLH